MMAADTAITASNARRFLVHSSQSNPGSSTSEVVFVSNVAGISKHRAMAGHGFWGRTREASHNDSVHSKRITVSGVASLLKAKANPLAARRRVANAAVRLLP